MSSSYIPLSKILCSFKNTYKSLGIAVFSTRSENQWIPILTVFSFSWREPTELVARHEALQAEFGAIDSEDFKIVYEAIPQEKIENLLENLATSKTIYIKGMALDNPSYSSILDRCGYIEKWHSEYSGDDSRFPFFASRSGNRSPLLNGDKILRLAQTAGYGDIYLALSTLMQVSAESIKSHDLIAIAPIYSRLENVRWDPSGGIRADLIQHNELNKTTMQLLQKSTDRYGNHQKVKKTSKAELLIDFPEGSVFTRKDCIADLVGNQLSDLVTVSLIHEEVGEIFSEERRFANYMTSQARNPLSSILGFFCSSPQFEGLLTQPHSNKKPASTFERSVSWLLACAGFSVIWLGKEHEIMHEHGTNVELGSLDLIACHFEKRIVLLAGCTIDVPSAREIDRLQNLKNIINKRLPGVDHYNFTTALFTASTNIHLIHDLAAKADVPLFDGDMLSKLCRTIDGNGADKLISMLSINQFPDFD